MVESMAILTAVVMTEPMVGRRLIRWSVRRLARKLARGCYWWLIRWIV